ncbi:hypothetical protein Ocin01_07549 [Orchesella cincta]|uniref:Uncharacterized protein n=1 Tax=Orchesella cincta TaxID=48709 RepID=A0A1D2N1J9_ORCCI|nr:hypothetical protein Ocin01_07549 [Orchesella cincta]
MVKLTLLGSGFLLILLASGLELGNAESIVLDLHSHASKEWLDISCVYNDDYKDFWVFGYPVTLTPEEGEGGAGKKGFWTPGTAESCEIKYYGGPAFENPKSLTLQIYIKGTSSIIEVKGRKSPLEAQWDEQPVVPPITSATGEGWRVVPIDMASQTDAKALTFYLRNTGGTHKDRLLLDSIIVDLGEDVPAPTTTPPTSTEDPIQDELVTLNTDRDYFNIWETNCHYADSYTNLSPFGKDCAINPTSAIPADFGDVGFWTPCSGGSCRIRYVSNSTVVPNVPSTMQLKTYAQGNPSIEISLQDMRYVDSELDCENCQPIHSLLMDKNEWSETDVSLLKTPAMHYIVNIDLVAGPDDKIVVNQVSMNLVVMTTTEPTSTTPTTPRGTGETDGETGTGSTPVSSTESAASSSFVKETLFAHIVMLSLYFILGK